MAFEEVQLYLQIFQGECQDNIPNYIQQLSLAENSLSVIWVPH